MTAWVTVEELAEVFRIPVATIRYHCRDPRGQLHRHAVKRSGRWTIPADVARTWAENYSPYGSLRAPDAATRPGLDPREGAQ